MVTHDVGVRRKMSYEVKRINEEYFDLKTFGASIYGRNKTIIQTKARRL